MKKYGQLPFFFALIFTLIFGTFSFHRSFAQETCANLFSQNHPSSAESELFLRIQKLLFGQTPPINRNKLLQAAQEEIRQLEELLGVPYSSEQRNALLNEMIQKSSTDEYSILVHGPQFRGVNIEKTKISYDNTMAAAFTDRRLNLIDHAYMDNPRVDHQFKPQAVDDSSTILIGRAKKDWNGNRSAMSALRILKRSPQQPTVIEKFLHTNNIHLPELQHLIDEATTHQQNVFEIGRVLNGTADKKVMMAQRLLLHHYFTSPNPSSLFVLSASSEKLVQYYEKWGFQLINSWRDPNSSKTLFFMAATGQELSQVLVQSLKIE